MPQTGAEKCDGTRTTTGQSRLAHRVSVGSPHASYGRRADLPPVANTPASSGEETVSGRDISSRSRSTPVPSTSTRPRLPRGGPHPAPPARPAEGRPHLRLPRPVEEHPEAADLVGLRGVVEHADDRPEPA